jgi:hypothetical protein
MVRNGLTRFEELAKLMVKGLRRRLKAPALGRHPSVDVAPGGLLAVLLNARGAQAGETVLIDGQLPAQEFFGCQGIALTGFLKAQKPATNGSDDLGLASDHPTTGG